MKKKIHSRLYRLAGNQTGISLVELLIGSLISLIIAAGIMEFYLTQHNQWLAQEQVSDMQQNGRAVMDELTGKIRIAGYGMPKGCRYFYASNTDPDTITVVLVKGPNCSPTIEHDMPQPSSELRCDGHDLSCFADSQWAYIFDPATKTGEFFWVTQVQDSSSHIQHNTMSLSKAYPKGSRVLSLDIYKYYIDNTTDPNHPRFMRIMNFGSPEIFAEDIEGLDFIYTLSNGSTTSTPAANADIRSVLFTITAKTERKDQNYASNSGFRKRNFQSQILVRNSNSN